MKFRITQLFMIALFIFVAAKFASRGHLSNLVRASSGITNWRNGKIDWASNTWGQNYYQELAKAFLAGQTSLLVNPPEELLKLDDPYDPQRNVNLRLHDASLYKGKYYFYWGPAPVIFFVIPWKFVFGCFPSDFMANLFFYLLFSLFAYKAFAECISDVGTGPPKFQWISFIMICFNGGLIYCLATPIIYVTAVLADQAFIAIALWAGLKFIRRPRNYWAAILGLASGLALASRASIAPLCLLIVIATFWMAYRAKHRLAEIGAGLASALIPLSLIIAELGWYNYSRFESPFEIGMRYQLIHKWSYAVHPFIELSKTALVERMPRNFLYTLLTPPQLHRHFPFFSTNHFSPSTSLPYEAEGTVGVVWLYLPVLLVGALALPKFRKIAKNFNFFDFWDAPMPWVWVGSLGMFLVTLFYCFNNLRYSLDFLPFLVIASEIYLFKNQTKLINKIRFIMSFAVVFLAISLGRC